MHERSHFHDDIVLHRDNARKDVQEASPLLEVLNSLRKCTTRHANELRPVEIPGNGFPWQSGRLKIKGWHKPL